jgi:cbb3-type cytochrome oxidase subunit 3
MGVLILTIFLSLILVGLFLVLFIRERRRRGFRSSEQDALLPFEDEDPRPDP